MKKATRELLAKIKGIVDAGEPLSGQLVRIARSQASLRGVVPQYMVCSGWSGNFHALPPGILSASQWPEHTEIHDMWRPVQPSETCWRLDDHGAPVRCDELERAAACPSSTLTAEQFMREVDAEHTKDLLREIAELERQLAFAVSLRDGTWHKTPSTLGDNGNHA